MVDQPGTLVDTHCHLYMAPLLHDRAGVQERARQYLVADVVVPAYDQASWDLMTPYETTPNLHTAYGIHPWLAHEMPPGRRLAAAVAALKARLDAASPVAIGEIGLDSKIDTSTPAQQLPLLAAQLQVAVDRDLPVILHCRGAFEEMLAALAVHQGRVRGVLHAFSRGPELGQRFLDAGLHVAFGGAITRPTAKRPRKAALRLPLDRILLETDAPSIGLDGVLPQDTEPAHVAQVAAALAAMRGLTLEQVAAATTHNARTLFRLSSPEGEATS